MIDAPSSRFPQRWPALLLVLFLLLFSLPFPIEVDAQTDATFAYWRYDALGRIDLLEVSDVNADGIDEFVVVAEDTNVTLVQSNGIPAWESYQTDNKVLQMALGNLNGESDPAQEIVLGTQNELIVLTAAGELLWEAELETPPVTGEALNSLGDSEWRLSAANPLVIEVFDHNNDGLNEILVALRAGQLRLLDGVSGEVIWEFVGREAPAFNAFPLLLIEDLDRDGEEEIAFSYFTQRDFTELVILHETTSQQLWRHSISGRAVDLTSIAFDLDATQPLALAVGTTRGEVHLYDGETGIEQWLRTPNVQVTSMTALVESERSLLIIGTAAGTLLAYDKDGRRLWDHAYAESADHTVVNVNSVIPEDGRSATSTNNLVRLLVTLAPTFTTRSEPANVLLLDGNGRTLERYNPASVLGLSRLTDINHDGKSELLMASFGTLSLSDPGLGGDAQRFVVADTFRLDARPRVVKSADLNGDGDEELLVGADDGRLHLLQADGATPIWQRKFEGTISHIELAPNESGGEPLVVIIHNTVPLADEDENASGWVELLNPDGTSPLWATVPQFESEVTALLVADINGVGRPEIVVGLEDGRILAYSLLDLSSPLWELLVDAPIKQLSLMSGIQNRSQILVATENAQLVILNNKGREESVVDYPFEIRDVLVNQADEPLIPMVIVTQDGQVRSFAADQGEESDWTALLGDAPLFTIRADQSLLVATNESRLVRLSADTDTPLETVWVLSELGAIRSVYWRDLNGDVRPDVAIGNEAGSILLFDSEGRPWGETLLGSSIFTLTSLRDGNTVNLVAVTENGVVHRLSAQANRPPLLVNPLTEISRDLYSVSVNVLDVDNDEVSVDLLLYDANNDVWLPQGIRYATRGDDILFWPALPTQGSDSLRYRFRYSDGTYNGFVEPALGPQPPTSLPWTEIGFFMGTAVIMGLVTIFFRLSPQFGFRVNTFYNQLRSRPRETLILLDLEYTRQKGAPDFLINLSNRARRERDPLISSLTDGLYLLPDRPETGLGILVSVLEEAQRQGKDWWRLDVWLAGFKTLLAMLQAPTTVELGLLRPRLVQVVEIQDREGIPSIAFESLLAPLNSLRDSNRVTKAEDRLVYLHEASVLLRQQQALVLDRPLTIHNVAVMVLLNRWSGLVNAAIDDLRGRAWLSAQLKTKRLVPNEHTIVALELENEGRAAAENVHVVLQEDPAAFVIVDSPDPIPVLAAGRKRLVKFTIKPLGLDSMRLVFDTDYDDMTRRDHAFEFADMVHMLPPVHEFKPIMNPYAPGTPLRRRSPLFYGRAGLLRFIISNVERGVAADQPSVLILVGERRTGKTSALLRLETYAPDHLLPVYIDCQSFGVIEGMSALLHDIAWFIADALAVRDYEIEVPDLDAWEGDPAHFFQRQFLPAVYDALPNDTTLILVFDEFEAFENLVNDGILPQTFFPFLRHLMQHGHGLSFVFAGTHRLEEMSTDYWSVLFNIALYQQVGYLDEAAARALICQPVAPHIIYDDLAIDKILRVTAGHPYFLQLVCYTLVNRANQHGTGYITISDVNLALKDMLRLGEVHFAYLWQQSTSYERALLTAVAHLHDHEVPFQPAEILQSLEQYNVYLEPAQALTSLNSLVERGIMRELVEEGVSSYVLRIGLVGLWTAQNKSLAQLHQDDPLLAHG